MLYLSTRNRADSFTAHRMLRSTAAPDGGLFMPMQVPVLSEEEIRSIQNMSFGETTAYIMNLFFGTNLTGWDVDFAVGRQAVSMASIGHRVSIVECWRNPAGTFAYLVRRLNNLVCQSTQEPNFWFSTCVCIAVLFSMYGKCRRQSIRDFDIALQSGDLQLLFALRYAERMGLPVGKIILGTLDGDGLWEFFSYGDYATGGKKVPSGLEALLWFQFGPEQAAAYLEAVQKGAIYHLDPVLLVQLHKDMFVAVVGERRMQGVASGVLRTDSYAMEQGTARAFGALQDYRSKTGENKNTLMIALSDGKKSTL